MSVQEKNKKIKSSDRQTTVGLKSSSLLFIYIRIKKDENRGGIMSRLSGHGTLYDDYWSRYTILPISTNGKSTIVTGSGRPIQINFSVVTKDRISILSSSFRSISTENSSITRTQIKNRTRVCHPC